MDFVHAIVVAVGLGLWTALQPCPMATNIAAISYIGRRVGSPRRVLLAGLLYALGRTLAYVGLAILLSAGAVAAWRVSTRLQDLASLVLGPASILTAMVLLELIRFPLPGAAVGPRLQARLEAWGVWGALPLGALLALAFCPVSAACFFISLATLLASYHSRIVLPMVYGLGTALPVVVFAVLIARGVRALAPTVDRVRRVETWVRRLAAAALLAVGFHFSIKYNLDITPAWDPWLGWLSSAWESLVRSLRG